MGWSKRAGEKSSRVFGFEKERGKSSQRIIETNGMDRKDWTGIQNPKVCVNDGK
jgi:hypothetical protein